MKNKYTGMKQKLFYLWYKNGEKYCLNSYRACVFENAWERHLEWCAVRKLEPLAGCEVPEDIKNASRITLDNCYLEEWHW